VLDGGLKRTDKAQCDNRSTCFQVVLDCIVDIALGRFPKDGGLGSHAFERR